MVYIKQPLSIGMFVLSFFTAFFLIGVLANNSLTDEVQIFDGILLSIISCLSFVAGKWLNSKIEISNSLLENRMDESLAQSVLNLWMITGAVALYISFNPHRNLEDFVLLEVLVFSLALWKTSANQLNITENDLIGVKSELEVTESKLKTTKIELKTTENKLKTTEIELKTTENKLKTTEIELKTTENKLKTTEIEINVAKEQLKELTSCTRISN